MAFAFALFLLFIAVPFLELYVIIQVASVIGTGWTILLLVAESILGAWLCKREGAGVLRRINAQLQAGQLPTTDVVNGALILLAGALMVTPGFLTDLLGFLLLIPPTRAVARAVIVTGLTRRVDRAMREGSDASFRVVRVTNTAPNGSASGAGWTGSRTGFGGAPDGSMPGAGHGTVLDASSRVAAGAQAAGGDLRATGPGGQPPLRGDRR